MTEHLLTTAAVDFEAARHVSILPDGHRSKRLHGHSFVAYVRSALPAGWASYQGGEVEELRAALARCIEPMDYNDLNRFVAEPTDENLVRFVREKLDIPGLHTVGIQSTRHEGVDLAQDDHAHIWRRYVFQSAHVLPNVPPGHKCGTLHGHGFEVIIHADQDLGARNMGIDYDHLDE
ncbi:MAG: 6-carboxytetrahydropterin synthase, partial [Gammaproteobacteria bacterium]